MPAVDVNAREEPPMSECVEVAGLKIRYRRSDLGGARRSI